METEPLFDPGKIVFDAFVHERKRRCCTGGVSIQVTHWADLNQDDQAAYQIAALELIRRAFKDDGQVFEHEGVDPGRGDRPGA